MTILAKIPPLLRIVIDNQNPGERGLRRHRTIFYLTGLIDRGGLGHIKSLLQCAISDCIFCSARVILSCFFCTRETSALDDSYLHPLYERNNSLRAR